MSDELSDVELLRRELTVVFDRLEERFQLLEQMQEATDQQMGMVVAAYVEVAAICDALTMIVHQSNPEAVGALDEELERSRKKMISVLERVTQDVEDGSTTTS